MTPRQAELLQFIAAYQREHGGVSPCFAEMAAGLKSKSKGNVHALLKLLEQDGYIARGENRTRAIRVLRLPRDHRFDRITADGPAYLAETCAWLEERGYRIVLAPIVALKAP